MESHHITDRNCKTSTYPDLFNTAAPKSPGRSKQRNVGMSNVPGETEKENRGEEMLLANVKHGHFLTVPRGQLAAFLALLGDGDNAQCRQDVEGLGQRRWRHRFGQSNESKTMKTKTKQHGNHFRQWLLLLRADPEFQPRFIGAQDRLHC